ncbi:MAG: class I tRNA ligase family protein, partial [Dokdonella sp.]
WPFSTMGWPGETPERANEWEQFKAFVPSNVLVTGFDIIFFWVARMVMATQYFTGSVPFREVYINAIVRDAEGQKMSKSKGNTIDPLDLIDGIDLESLVKKSTASLLIPQVREKVEKRIRKDYPDGIAAVGADAMRFTFAALATYGRTINFDLKRAEGYKNFCNKLWNAARFVLMNCEEPGFGIRDSELDEAPATEAERWILTRMHHTLAEVEGHYATYRFDLIAQALYEFVWNEYCDWFLELAKPALNGDDNIAADSTRSTLLVVLEAVLRALHPITPFVTEEIWHEVAPVLARSSLTAKDKPASMPDFSTKSISQCVYPRAGDFAIDEAATAEIEWLKAVLSQLRRIRSEMNIPPGKTIPLLYVNGNSSDRARTAKFVAQIAFLARTESQRWLDTGETEPPAAAAIVGKLKLLIPLAGLIDLGAEKLRLEKEIKRIDVEIVKCNGKLGTSTFVTNAPPAVVEQEKQRLTDFTTTLAALREQLASLAKM